MKIEFTNKFLKSYSRLSSKNMKKIDAALGLFKKNPFSKKLKNHALKGKYKGYRSFSAGYDLRIIYREESEHLIVFLLDTGTHAQVYK